MTKYFVVCIDDFEEKFIKHEKSRSKLNWHLHPVPTIHQSANSQLSLLRASTVLKRSSTKRIILESDGLEVYKYKPR